MEKTHHPLGWPCFKTSNQILHLQCNPKARDPAANRIISAKYSAKSRPLNALCVITTFSPFLMTSVMAVDLGKNALPGFHLIRRTKDVYKRALNRTNHKAVLPWPLGATNPMELAPHIEVSVSPAKIDSNPIVWTAVKATGDQHDPLLAGTCLKTLNAAPQSKPQEKGDGPSKNQG